MPIQINEMRLQTVVKGDGGRTSKTAKATAPAVSADSKAKDEYIIRETVRRVLEILAYKLR